MKNELESSFEMGPGDKKFLYISDRSIAEGTLWGIKEVMVQLQGYKESSCISDRQIETTLRKLIASAEFYLLGNGTVTQQTGALELTKIIGRLVSHNDRPLGQLFHDLGYLIGKTHASVIMDLADDVDTEDVIDRKSLQVYEQVGVWSSDWKNTPSDMWNPDVLFGPGPLTHLELLEWLFEDIEENDQSVKAS